MSSRLSNVGSLAAQSAGAVAITGGNIDGATLGATTPAAGTFTALSANAFKGMRLISKTAGVNLNATGDVTLTMIAPIPATWILRRVIFTNASASLATSIFAGTLRTAAAGAGTTLCAALATTGLTGATVFVDQTLTLSANTTTAQTLFINRVTGSGLTGTVDVYVFADDVG